MTSEEKLWQIKDLLKVINIDSNIVGVLGQGKLRVNENAIIRIDDLVNWLGFNEVKYIMTIDTINKSIFIKIE